MAKQFQRLPVECVSLCGENIGIPISQEVEDILAEDVSYRSRQITNIACQFMHHAKRRKLATNDMLQALKWSNIEPVYGHNSLMSSRFQPIHESGLYSTVDNEVRLTDEAHDTPVIPDHLLRPISTSAKWLSLEGSSLVNENGETSVESGSIVELKTVPSEAQHRYLSLLLEAITGEKEELRQVALHDIQSSAALANVLPYLCQFIHETMVAWQQFAPIQLVRFLRMVIAMFRNQTLFLDPYANGLLTLLHTIVLDSRYLHLSDSSTHWNVRELAACALAEIVRKCSTPLSDYHNDLKASFSHQLTSQKQPSLPTLYGIVMSLCYLGGKSIGEILLPVLAHLSSYIQGLLESSPPSGQQDALRVYSTILMAAEVLLVSSYGSSFNLSNIIPALVSSAPVIGVSPDIDTEQISSWGNITLYEFLVELFGERLVLKLEAHTCISNLSISNEDRKKYDVPLSTLSTNDIQTSIDRAFQRHQMREGFVSLHHLVCSQRLVTMRKPIPTTSMNCHPFCIRMYRLPVIQNVLELTASPVCQYDQNNSRSLLMKGKIRGTKRCSLANYMCTDVKSCWL